jgi:hypothetical protein
MPHRLENDRTLASSLGTTPARRTRRDVRKAAAAGLLIFAVFNLNLRAIVSRDSRIIELTAASIGLWHTATLDRFPDLRGSDGVLEVDGHLLPL